MKTAPALSETVDWRPATLGERERLESIVWFWVSRGKQEIDRWRENERRHHVTRAA